MKKILALGLAAGMAFLLAACGQASEGGNGSAAETGGTAAVSEEKAGGNEVIKIICPYGVGGTADIIARKYALVAGKHYPNYNFIVENMTGGDGFAGATYYTELPASTKELLIYGYGVAYRHDAGKKYESEIVDFDRSEIYPVASIDDRTQILYVKPGVTLADVLAKAKSEGIKMSGGNPLSGPHLTLGSLIAKEGGKVMVVPYDGGASQKKALMDGEVDVFVGTTQVGQEDVEMGTLIPILAFSENAFEGFITPEGPISVPGIVGEAKAPELDSAIDFTESILPTGGFIAVRTGADPEWIEEITEMTKAVWADPEYSDWIAEIMLNKFEVYGEEAKAYLEEACERSLIAFETLK